MSTAIIPITALLSCKLYCSRLPLSLFIQFSYELPVLSILTSASQTLCCQNLPLLEFLISNGADVNMETMQGSHLHRNRHKPNGTPLGTTALDIAAVRCSPIFLQRLIDHDAKLEKSNALHAAAAALGVDTEDRIPILQYLLDQGMDVNAIEGFSEDSKILPGERALGTPLHYAARWGHVNLVKFLLAHGADPTIEGTQGSGRPLDWAREKHGVGDGELISLLSSEV